MLNITRNIIIMPLVCLLISFSEAFSETNPVEIFAELNGTWKGAFVGYDQTGNELYRIKVKQTYQTVNDTTQTVHIEDSYPNGEIVTGEGQNIIAKEPDGTLSLKCIVRKSNGEHVQHHGRVMSGPMGKKQLIWYSEDHDRSEVFREAIEEHADGIYYTINGTGIYGNTLVLMAGSYRKQTEP